MNIKKNNALAGIDMIIAIITIMIFSTLILALMSNNAMQNMKTAKETLAMIYITEIFENIGIADYDSVLEENTNDFIPQEALNTYQIDMKIENDFEDIEDEEQNIVKKVYVTLTYEIGNKTYSCSMERLKIKE